MRNKVIKEEISRISEIMGLDSKNLITEDISGPLLRLLRKAFSNAETIERGAVKRFVKGTEKGAEKLFDIETPVFNNIRNELLKTDFSFSNLGKVEKEALIQLIEKDPEMMQEITPIISNFAKKQNIGVGELYKRLAKSLQTLRETNPGHDIEVKDVFDDAIKKWNAQNPSEAIIIDEFDLQILANYLEKEVKPYLPNVKIDGTLIKPVKVSTAKELIDHWLSPTMRRAKYMWFKGYFKKIKKTEELIKKEIGKIMEKSQRLNAEGNPDPQEVMSNIKNIWYMIAGTRQSMTSKGYREYIEKYLLKNEIIPKEELEKFFNNPGVKRVMSDDAEDVQKRAMEIFKKVTLAKAKSYPITNYIAGLVEDGFKGIPRLDRLLPLNKNFVNRVLFRNPLLEDETLELAMKNSKYGSIVELGASLLVWDTLILPALENFAATTYQNWLVIPKLNQKIALVKQYCNAGLLKDKEGNTITDCESYVNELKKVSETDFLNNLKYNNPFSDFVSDVKGLYTEDHSKLAKIFGTLLIPLSPFTNVDEFYNDVIRRIPGWSDKKLIPYEEWKRVMVEPFDKKMETIKNQLRPMCPNVDNPEEFRKCLEKAITDATNKNPELKTIAGNYDNTEKDFKEYLIDSGYDESQVINSGLSPDDKTQKLYLIDKTKGVDEYENPKFRYINNTFVPIQ